MRAGHAVVRRVYVAVRSYNGAETNSVIKLAGDLICVRCNRFLCADVTRDRETAETLSPTHTVRFTVSQSSASKT